MVGQEWISEDRAVIETYSRFSVDTGGVLRKHQRHATMIPACIVLPGSTEEVQAIMRIANRFGVQVIPFTNGMIAFNGPTTPLPTICVHVSRMNRVHIDEENLTATLEAYGDYGQLQAEAMKRGLWNGGTPLATTLCKLSSQSAFAGIWQTDLKYGTLTRNIVSIKVVLPTGDILITGSDTVSGANCLWEYGPGPDLMGLQRSGLGTNGIVVEITVKLHAWTGGESFPELAAGRPSLVDVHDEKYDNPPEPLKNHKLLWAEFKDFESQLRAMRDIEHCRTETMGGHAYLCPEGQ